MNSPTLEEVEAALRAGWSARTSDDPHEWTPDNPSRGQCAVSALVVKHYFGGEVMIAPVLAGGGLDEFHCWTELPSGEIVDFTTDQFGPDFAVGDPVDLVPIVDDMGEDRSVLLLQAVRQHLASCPPTRTDR